MPRSASPFSVDDRASSETASWATADRGESLTRRDSEDLTVVGPDPEEFDATEETSLLGAGAGGPNYDDGGQGVSTPPHKRDPWDDDPDFEHLPRWRRPAVS